MSMARTPLLRRRRPARPTGELPEKIWTTAVMWLLIVVYGIPVLWFVLSSFKPAGELFSYPLTIFTKHPTITGYTQAWTSFDFARYFVNSMIVAVSATSLTIVTSAMSGYALAKYNNWWLKGFALCILATTMLPAET